jgi:protein tyrosine phosphatase (PTP) superfamily phosphohydrolase (DUF442 family)
MDAGSVEAELGDIYNFLQIDDKLATGGMPTEDQLALLKEAGYEVVINLAMPNQPNALPNEAEIVTELEMEYHSIPVVFNNPTTDDLARLMDMLDANTGRKCFVHCMANHRVSVFVYLYRVLRRGVPPHEAEALLHRIWQPNAVWAKFIQDTLAQK